MSARGAISRGAAALFLTLLSGPLAAQNAALDRLTLRGDLLGWEAVGRLDLGSRATCSGVLIASNLVLTAAHCLAEAKASGRVNDIVFRAGLRDGEAVAEAVGGRAVLHPGYRPGAGVSRANIATDVALLELAAPIPTATAAPFKVAALPRAGASVSVVSYGRGRNDAPSHQASCRVRGRDAALVAFDCDVTFGSSGAPLFDTSGQRARIVSLVSSGGSNIAFGMALPTQIRRLKYLLRTGDGVFPKREIRARRISVGERGAGGARFLRPE